MSNPGWVWQLCAQQGPRLSLACFSTKPGELLCGPGWPPNLQPGGRGRGEDIFVSRDVRSKTSSLTCSFVHSFIHVSVFSYQRRSAVHHIYASSPKWTLFLESGCPARGLMSQPPGSRWVHMTSICQWNVKTGDASLRGGCGQNNAVVGRITVPEDVPVPIPGDCHYATLCGTKSFAAMNRFRAYRWGDYRGLTKAARCNLKGP